MVWCTLTAVIWLVQTQSNRQMEQDARVDSAEVVRDQQQTAQQLSDDGEGDTDAVPLDAVPLDALRLDLRVPTARPLVGLELPVYATDANLSRMLETIGGLKTLQQTHDAKSQFLPVKLRPNEPSCKPLFADLTKTQTILLRVKRTKRRSGPEHSSDNVAEDAVEADIVGIAKEKYVCEGMADFQYFTARKFYPASVENEEQQPSPVNPTAMDVTQPTYKGSASQLSIKASLRPYMCVQQESELELIPEVFSKVDLPLKYEFRQRSGYQPTETTKKPSSTMTYLNFHDDVPAPAAPKPENPLIRRRPVGANECVDEHVLQLLHEKLAAKPIWLRPKLFVGLDFLERRAARRILRKLCYVFVDGPWRGSWIRMGYDPRQSNESAKYQVIELRNNRELVHAKVTHPSRKRTKKYSGLHPKGPRIVKVTQTSEHENAQASKRRRKERFMRGETRRSYLVDPSAPSPASNDHDSVGAGELRGDWDSDNETEPIDDGIDAASVTSGGRAGDPSGSNETTYEIFGAPLTSANVLFQLDEIEDAEVKAWITQFDMQSQPSLLGGWYPSHMFLSLREIVRYRIAALVGRSKAELETRRKRIDALKKQALSDYADYVVNGNKTPNHATGVQVNSQQTKGGSANIVEGEDPEEAFERSLAEQHAARLNGVPNEDITTRETNSAANAEEEDEGEDMELDEEDDDETNETRQQRAIGTRAEEDDDDDDDEEEDDEDDAEGHNRLEMEAPSIDNARASREVSAEASASAPAEPATPMEYSF